MPPTCALLGGFAIGASVALLWEHNANSSLRGGAHGCWLVTSRWRRRSQHYCRGLDAGFQWWRSGVIRRTQNVSEHTCTRSVPGFNKWTYTLAGWHSRRMWRRRAQWSVTCGPEQCLSICQTQRETAAHTYPSISPPVSLPTLVWRLWPQFDRVLADSVSPPARLFDP